MRLKEEFVTVIRGETAITVSTNTKLFSGMIRSNSTAAFIIRCLEKETTKEEIVNRIMQEYKADIEVVSKDVQKTIDQLRTINALCE